MMNIGQIRSDAESVFSATGGASNRAGEGPHARLRITAHGALFNGRTAGRKTAPLPSAAPHFSWPSLQVSYGIHGAWSKSRTFCSKNGVLWADYPQPSQGPECPDPRHVPGHGKNAGGMGGGRPVKTVAIRGAGPRPSAPAATSAPCMTASIAGTPRRANSCADEYRLNAMIGAYPKPYVALTAWHCDGRRGRGLGAWQPSPWPMRHWSSPCRKPPSVLSPISAPAISSPAVPARPACIWRLTGARIGLGDALALGLFTHAVKAKDHDALLARLAEGEAPDTAIAAFAFNAAAPASGGGAAPASIRFSRRIRWKRCWNGWTAMAATLPPPRRRPCAANRPRRSNWFSARCGEAKDKNLNDCLKMEYRVAARAVMAHDFREGVRAILIDKDGRPHWRPSALAAVSDERCCRLFRASGRGRTLPCRTI